MAILRIASFLEVLNKQVHYLFVLGRLSALTAVRTRLLRVVLLFLAIVRFIAVVRDRHLSSLNLWAAGKERWLLGFVRWLERRLAGSN